MTGQQQHDYNQNLEQLGTAFEEFKATHARALKDMDATQQAKLHRIADDFGMKHEALTRMLSEEVAKMQRPGGADSPEAGDEVKQAERFAIHRKSLQNPDNENFGRLRSIYGETFPDYEPTNVDAYKRYRKAFVRYLQVGNKGDLSLLGAELQKDMSIGIDPDGGYFMLPPTIADHVIARQFETSPMWELSDVVNISTRSFIQPEDPSDINAGWVAERTVRTPTTTITPTRIEIPAQEEYAEPALSQQLLEDAAIDIDSYIAGKLVDKFNRIENTAFVVGSGAGQPRGFMSYPMVVVNTGTFTGWNQLEQINSGSPGEFTYTGLTKLVTSLKEPFQNNAKFLIQRQAIYYILNLTDGNGRLIFQPLVNGNLNKTPLLGYELRYATDMPGVATASNAMAFGDWKQGYKIVNRVGLSILRDPYTAKPFILVYTRKRTGGAVVNFDAIKIHSLQ